MLSSYDRLAEWLVGLRVGPTPLTWEEYLTGPDTTDDPAAWRTRIVYPLPPQGRRPVRRHVEGKPDHA